jgi:Protein of unknown function (DUF3551)
MKKVMTAAFALSALFAASGKAHADVNYPWCIIGNTRAVDCYFSSREQCAQDGRNRGFGGQCIKNPFYKPGPPNVSRPVNKRTLSQTARPSQGGSAAQHLPWWKWTVGRPECKLVYVGGPVSKEACGASSMGINGSACPGAWRYACSR